MPVNKILKVIIIRKNGDNVEVRADYEKSVAEENLVSGFSLDVTALIPNWGLEAKWNSVQSLVEQHG